MNLMRKLCLFILLAPLFVTSAWGQWYQSTGKATIIEGDREAARVLAMENALKKALLVSGASVNSIQQVVNGLLTEDMLSVRASGTVNSVEITDEIYEDGVVSLTIRADVFPQEQQCFAADYKKTMLITRATLLNREQANIGQIYALDKQLVSKLASKLKASSQFIDTKLANKHKVAFSRYNQSFDTEQIKMLSMELGERFDAQFVLFTEINDLSFGQDSLNGWSFWQEDEFNRQFNVSFYVYSTLTGEMLAEQHYQNKAPWQFGRRESVDLTSNTFWNSRYGQMLNSTLDNAIIDIDENMMCEQTRAKIIQVDGNEIVINVGSNQGVQVNDSFTLLHSNHFKTQRGKMYSGYNVSPYQVQVTKLYKNTAVATTKDKSLLGNIQIDDLAVKERF